MDGQVLTELESAAQILLASPAVVTAEQRKSAENLFLNFRKTKSPYGLCRHILETSSVDFVQFEAASLLKDALIREWSFLGESHVISLQQYLLQYIIQKQLPASVRERILQVIAIMVKRASVDDFGISRGHLLAEVEQLILSGDPPRRIIGCNIISSLIQEYSNTVKSSDVGLPWETHFKAKKQFEVTDLKRIFQFCVQALSEMTKDDVSLTVETLNLLKHLVCNTWQRKRDIHMTESSRITRIKCWKLAERGMREAFQDTVKIELSKDEIHWRVRTTPEISHHTVTCLVQLASLSGHVIVNDKEIRIQYLTNYIKNFLHLVTSVNILDQEALGISNIVRKLILFFPTSLLICLPSELLQSFLEQLAKLTCQFAEGAAQEESVCADDCLYMEAFDHMLEAWISVLHNSQEFPKDFCKQSAMQIFNTYLKCHLSPPDGTRGQGEIQPFEAKKFSITIVVAIFRDFTRKLNPSTAMPVALVPEIDDTEENDRTKFQDQLMTIGVVGRHVPGHSLTILCKLLEERTRRLYGQLQRLHSQAMNISDNSILDCLFEDIHWLVLIAAHHYQPSHSQPTKIEANRPDPVLNMSTQPPPGYSDPGVHHSAVTSELSHVVSMDSQGEAASIPSEIMQYSIQQGASGQVNVQTTLKLLASPACHLPDIPGAEESSDHFVSESERSEQVGVAADIDKASVNTSDYYRDEINHINAKVPGEWDYAHCVWEGNSPQLVCTSGGAHVRAHALLTVQVSTGTLKWLTTQMVRPRPPTGSEPRELKAQNSRSSDPIVPPTPSLVGL
uniref:Exportin-4 n=1 Tax=Timema genevievae TaxID=629358 RepID=A0A7R9JVA6_TIMGE|nr:unnamed protein product [Timema genevievae]